MVPARSKYTNLMRDKHDDKDKDDNDNDGPQTSSTSSTAPISDDEWPLRLEGVTTTALLVRPGITN